ncbi:MAG: TonB-dependent receptor [Burkholderiales bacterium]|nr:TonB-dependent receptor [Burkholderiales bacterium]
MKPPSLPTAAAALLTAASLPALACSSCGCTLNSDWSTQGLHAGPGLSLDLRHDDVPQDQLRQGSHGVDPASFGVPAEQEIQHRTFDRITTLSLDAGFDRGFGLNLQLPWIDRRHDTLAENDTERSASRSNSLGDVRVVGRWQGDPMTQRWGLQLGLKLATGATDVKFSAGPQAGQPLDRGLQPGTGSTDLLLGAFTFGSLTPHVDYFAQALLQHALASKAQFKPGPSLGISTGLRWVGDSAWVPALQINLRHEERESGANADIPNSGSTRVGLSPGLTWAASEQVRVYGFVQVPIFQHVNGLQLAPRFSASAGVHLDF